jgi:hypothetical protein
MKCGELLRPLYLELVHRVKRKRPVKWRVFHGAVG